MGLWQRFTTLFKSNVNDLIAKAEEPEKILNQLILDMNKQLVDAKKQVAVAIADEKRLKKQQEKEAALAKDWGSKAMLAVRANNDDLAKKALVRQTQYAKQAAELQEQWAKQKAASDQLRGTLQQLNNKIEEAKRKKNLLIARSRRAEAQKKIQATMHGLSESSAFDAFDRMAEKVEQKEAEADAQAELTGALTGDTLISEFEQLETGEADDALLALKTRMGLAEAPSAPAALPEATGVQDTNLDSLESELAALKEKASVTVPGSSGDGSP